MGNRKYKEGDWVLIHGYESPVKITYIGSNFYDAIVDGEIESLYDEDIIELVKESDECEPDMGEVSDGYHTFNELYEYRLLYNASMFNELAKQGLYDVHKSRKHSDGKYPFDNPNWFIVMAELPTGQISNHYEMKDWSLFDIPEKEVANVWDEHTPKDVAERLRRFLTPKPVYPKTYEDCAKVLLDRASVRNDLGYKGEFLVALQKLFVCRDAYWKIYGEEKGLGGPWEPDWREGRYIIYRNQDDIIGGYREAGFVEHHIFAFPTKEMRDTFKENFKKDIEKCKELL